MGRQGSILSANRGLDEYFIRLESAIWSQSKSCIQINHMSFSTAFVVHHSHQITSTTFDLSGRYRYNTWYVHRRSICRHVRTSARLRFAVDIRSASVLHSISPIPSRLDERRRRTISSSHINCSC